MSNTGYLKLGNKDITEVIAEETADKLTYSAQSLTPEQKQQVMNNLGGTWLALGGGNMYGNILFPYGRIVSVNNGIHKELIVGGDTNGTANDSAYIAIRNNNAGTDPGSILLITRNSTLQQGPVLGMYPDGRLLWNNAQVITSAGGVYTTPKVLCRDVDTGELNLFGGTGYKRGAHLSLRGSKHSIEQSSFTLTALNPENIDIPLKGLGNGSLTWNNKEVERVNSSGQGWIRYESGLQIVFGYVKTVDKIATITFPVPFVTSENNGGLTPTFWVNTVDLDTPATVGLTALTATKATVKVASALTISEWGVRYHILGRWK